MKQPAASKMSKERIIESLQELKAECLSTKTKSKYFYALGHAIRAIEDQK